MGLFRREKRDNGIVFRPTEHHCRPPGCHEWPAGEWKVDNTYKFPEGTIWKCSQCQKYWKSTNERNHLWLNWISYWRNMDREIEELEDA